MSWSELQTSNLLTRIFGQIAHYARENERYNKAQETITSPSGSKYVFHNTHDLSLRKPILKILTPSEAADVSEERMEEGYGEMVVCKICHELGVRTSEYYHTVSGKRSALAEHLRNA